MPPVILHVEDDLALRAIVELTFQDLGFRGTTVRASTIAQGEQLLDQAAQEGRTFDLILSDMHLTDGTGLDLVRHVRATPAWRTTPMLILSGDLDPKLVGRAYALGANAYIDKSPNGREISDVVRTLYRHWLTDVVRVRTPPVDRTDQVLTQSMEIRLRHAQIYVRIADALADNPSEAAFWLSRALGESNLTNLLGFVQQQVSERDLDDALLDDITEMQQATRAGLVALERDLDGTAMSRDDIYLKIIDLLGTTNITVVARSMARLFPKIPSAVDALRDFFVGAVTDVAAWIDLHTCSPIVRQRTAQLQASATPLVELDVELLADVL